MKELHETVALMTSADYKERFQAEFYQLETRYLKLKAMCDKWDKDELDFVPTCPRKVYTVQLEYMLGYIAILIHTLEGDMTAEINDYIIKGIKGEFYPCKPDIFEETYNIVENF